MKSWKLIIIVMYIVGVQLYSDTFDSIWGVVSEFESNVVVNNKHEHSKYGIRSNTLRHFNNKYSTTFTIKSLTNEQAKLIAKNEFYYRYNINKIYDELLQLMVFDWLYNAGPKESIKHLQLVANDHIYKLRKQGYTDIKYITEDGILGEDTVTILNVLSCDDFVHDYRISRILTYRQKDRYAIYGKGWLKRINSLKI